MSEEKKTTGDAVVELFTAIEDAGGTVTEIGGPLPDGSGFSTASVPLRSDHWLYAKHDNVPPMPFRCGCAVDHAMRAALAGKIRGAAQYAVRSATMNGEAAFDPDAIVQSFIVGMLGYYTPDGLSSDDWANPKPVPEEMRVADDTAARAEAEAKGRREAFEEAAKMLESRAAKEAAWLTGAMEAADGLRGDTYPAKNLLRQMSEARELALLAEADDLRARAKGAVKP